MGRGSTRKTMIVVLNGSTEYKAAARSLRQAGSPFGIRHRRKLLQ
jgi:hypothetical protein